VTRTVLPVFLVMRRLHRTDRYIDAEVNQLRKAVGDEAAIETLRSMIRADEDATSSFSSTKLNILIFRAHWGYFFTPYIIVISHLLSALYILFIL